MKIQDLDIRLKKGDETVVYEIARSKKDYLSFATKFCAMHNPDKFPIFDSFINRIFTHLNKNGFFNGTRVEEDTFKHFGQSEKSKSLYYADYKLIYDEFLKKSGISSYAKNYREVDCVLWGASVIRMKTLDNSVKPKKDVSGILVKVFGDIFIGIASNTIWVLVSNIFKQSIRMKKLITILFSVILLAVSCAKVSPDGNISVTGVTLDQTTLTIKVGDKETLVATVSPKNATNKDVIWSTSNKQVVTVEGGVVTAVAEGVAEITVTTDDGGKEAHCSVTVESSSKPTSVIVTGEYTDLACTTVSVCGWCYQKEEEGLSAIYGIEYSDTDLTTAATTVKAESKGQDNKFCCKLTRLIPNAKYFYRAYVLFNGIRTYGEVKTFTTTKPSCPSGAVDLGLSVCWATCNIGASKPEDYGGYYQWAGTKDVTSTLTYLDWSNCPYHIGSNQHTGWTKYYEGDNKVVLDLSDDVAYVTLGESWRMPTARECDELIDKCTWVWTTRNGVNGYAVKGNRSGYTDKSIFLPMEGNSAYYWCASCFFYNHDKNPEYGGTIYFEKSSIDFTVEPRYAGLFVRPVAR